MKLKKAIEVVNDAINLPEEWLDPDLNDSIKLLIEAGKRCQILAENSPLWAAKPLPGETKD